MATPALFIPSNLIASTVINESLPSLGSIKSCFCSNANRFNRNKRVTRSINTRPKLSKNEKLRLREQLNLHHLPTQWENLVNVPNTKWTPAIEIVYPNTAANPFSHVSTNSFAQNKKILGSPLFQLSSLSGLSSSRIQDVTRRFKTTSAPKSKILFLEYIANSQPGNGLAQANYLREIVNEDPEYVIKRIASGRYVVNDDVKTLHMKALILTDQLSADELKRKFNYAPSGSGQPSLNLGTTEQSPMHVVMVEDKKGSFGKRLRSFYSVFVFAVSFSVMYMLFTRFVKMPNLFDNREFVPDTTEKTYRFGDVEGCDEAKEELQEVVEFLRNPEKFQRLGAKLPGGVLLIGPPGTGKTLLARAIAGEAEVPFFFASGSEFDEMFVGVGAARIRKLFAAAKEHAPSIVFMDELDAIGGKRNANDNQPHSRMTLNQLLVELDGFSQTEGVIVIGATNFPEILDKALTRPGRFDSKVHVTLPDVRGRSKILDLYLKKSPVMDDVDVEVLARGTPGFSGADLSNLVNQAALRAASLGEELINMDHIEWARDKIMMGPERRSAVITEKNRTLVAYHEGGHAIVALFTPDAEPVHKATVIPRGSALGYVMQLPEKDSLSWTRKQLLAKMDVCMGGRVAEEMIFGEDAITTGASSDMQQASRVARAMVTQYGMSDKVGTVLIDEIQETLSPDLQALIESEVKRLIQEAYERAKKILSKHAKEHKRLAEGLLKYETLDAGEIKLVIAGKPIAGR